MILAFLYGMLRLASLGTSRKAFYTGFSIGLAIYGPHLAFFWTIFNAGALLLWSILAAWLGLFLLLARACLMRFGPIGLGCTAPILWTGIEFFRSELYWLKFSWLGVGYAFSDFAALPQLAHLGVYGIGFAAMTVAAGLYLLPVLPRIAGSALITVLSTAALLFSAKSPQAEPHQNSIPVAGLQLEFPDVHDVIAALNRTIERWPSAELLVLSEYTFDGPVPELIKKWCKQKRKHLILGAKDELPSSQFYNTAFVISPEGKVIFSQAKSVPIQFFKDGRPAPAQKLWHSPWGALGMAICYDASYTRVIDELVRQGAQALILPTMDIIEWGEYQHKLHARIAPLRAAEYGLPLIRVCSSGVSQLVNTDGQVVAAASFPGQCAMLAGTMHLPKHGHIPPDRVLARLCVCFVAALICWLGIKQIRASRNSASELASATMSNLQER